MCLAPWTRWHDHPEVAQEGTSSCQEVEAGWQEGRLKTDQQLQVDEEIYGVDLFDVEVLGGLVAHQRGTAIAIDLSGSRELLA